MVVKLLKKIFNKTDERKPNEKIIGSNNVVNIDNSVNYQVKINGENNSVFISCLEETGESRNIKINIKGNNNKILIKNLRTAKLNIDIGNYTGVNNVDIEILDNFVCAECKIWAYQHNTPIKIGKDCLFSNSVILRSGELPHAIYDATTHEDLDKTDGIFIGNHVWVGEHAYIMKRANIANDSIVGAMSVVTKKFDEEKVLIAGNPAKICKRNIMWNESAATVFQ